MRQLQIRRPQTVLCTINLKQECNFFGYLTTQTRPTEFTSQYEAEKYDEAVKKFALYNEVKTIFDQLNDFTLEIKEIYRVIEANNTSSNFFARSNSSDEVLKLLLRYSKIDLDLGS